MGGLSFSNHVVTNAHTPEKGFPTMTSGRHLHRPDTDRPGTGPIPVAGRPRGRPAVRSAGGATPRSGDSCTTAPPLPQDRVPPPGTSNPARRWPPGPAGKITVYECSDCGDRYLGEQRCESCGTFARRVGIGGACPNCDGPVAISDLLDQAVVTIAKK